MPVVAHHEIIIVFERVTVRRNAVDENAIAILAQGISFVIDDATRVQSQVFFVQYNGFSFFGNPNRTEIVARPARIIMIRIRMSAILIRIGSRFYKDLLTAVDKQDYICLLLYPVGFLKR